MKGKIKNCVKIRLFADFKIFVVKNMAKKILLLFEIEGHYCNSTPRQKYFSTRSNILQNNSSCIMAFVFNIAMPLLFWDISFGKFYCL